MEHDLTRNPAPAPDRAGVPAPTPDAPRQAVLDAHGFDPAEYDWLPVRRKPRVDGWSSEKQRLFIATLADTGSVTLAARTVGMTAKSAYTLRRAPDGAGFDRAWTAAIRRAMSRLIDVCMERALEGTEEPIHDREGRVIGTRVRHHDRMAMFLLRAHMPELFRPENLTKAHRADRAVGEPAPAAPEPIAEALERLDPVRPAAPHMLMDADDLEGALDLADACDGELPRWRRDPDLVAREAQAKADEAHADDAPPFGEQFERDLEAAKNGTWKPPAKSKRARRRQRVRV